MKDKGPSISIIVVDGSFRERFYAVDYFCNQTLDLNKYEVLWIEYYDKVNKELRERQKLYKNFGIITLNRNGEYHSSHCFNKGIVESRGEVLVIPDADQIVEPDFLQKVWDVHSCYDRLVVYGYRYDEPGAGVLGSFDFDELQQKCVMKMPTNFGACLTVRKKWLVEINGYEQHEIFSSGFHANGKDVAMRFKNLGLAIQWEPGLRLYHPYHPFTATSSPSYRRQMEIVEWRRRTLQYMAFDGIFPEKNVPLSQDLVALLLQNERVTKKEGFRLRIRRMIAAGRGLHRD